MVQPKEATEEVRKQTSTADGLGTIMPSSTSSYGLRTGTAQPALVPKVSPKSRLLKPKFYLSSTTPAQFQGVGATGSEP